MNLIVPALPESSRGADSPQLKTRATDKTRYEGSFNDYLTCGIPIMPHNNQHVHTPQKNMPDNKRIQEANSESGRAAPSPEIGELSDLPSENEKHLSPGGTSNDDNMGFSTFSFPSETIFSECLAAGMSLGDSKMSEEVDISQKSAENSIKKLAEQSPASLLKKEVSRILKGDQGQFADEVVSGSEANTSDSIFTRKDSDAAAVFKASSQTDVGGGIDKGAEGRSLETPPEIITTPEGDTAYPRHESFIKSAPDAEASSAPDILAEEKIRNQKKDQCGQSSENSGKSENIFSPLDKGTGQESQKVVCRKMETPEVSHIFRDDFVVTKRTGTSIEVSIEPVGIGKLDIHLNSDRGVIHARINASESVGRELIDRNLDSIINTLASDGINIGSFSINLRGRQKESEGMEKGPQGFRDTTEEVSLPGFHTGNNMINIFV